MLHHLLQEVIAIDFGNTHGRKFLTQAIHGHCPRHKHPLEKIKEDDVGALWPLFQSFPETNLDARGLLHVFKDPFEDEKPKEEVGKLNYLLSYP